MKVNKIFLKKSEKTKKDYLCGVPPTPNILVDKKKSTFANTSAKASVFKEGYGGQREKWQSGRMRRS